METSVLVSTTSFYLISRVFGKTMFIQSISDTSRKILNKIETGIYHNNDDVENMYIDTDIVVTINTLQLLVNEINNFNYSSTLNTALNNLNSIIIEIHDLIQLIEEKTNNHKQKYISIIRNVNLYREIKLVIKKNNILEKRLNLLIKVLQINRYNEKDVNSNNDRRIILYR